MWDNATIMMLVEGTFVTLYMTLVSTFMGYVLGLPMGIALVITAPKGLRPNKIIYKILGANLWTIIWKVMLAESRTSLLVNATIALGTILGYSAMAGAVGGGGLGDIAIRYGYYRYQTDIMLVTVVLLVLLVQLLQYIGMTISKKLDKRTR